MCAQLRIHNHKRIVFGTGNAGVGTQPWKHICHMGNLRIFKGCAQYSQPVGSIALASLPPNIYRLELQLIPSLQGIIRPIYNIVESYLKYLSLVSLMFLISGK